MKIKYLLIFLILSIPIVYATNILEIDLLTKTFGEDKELKGNVLLNYDNSFLATEKIKAYVDNKKTETILKNVLDNQNISYNLISGLYTTTTSFSQKTINQPSLFGIKIPLQSEITSAKLTLQRLDNPPTISIDIGNNNIIDWEYFGDFIKFGDTTLPNSTSKFIEDGTQLLPGDSNIFYCELINLSSSKRFRVFAKYEALSERADIFAVILNKQLQKQGECKLPDQLTNKWTACNLDLENPIKDDNLICINIKGGLQNEQYYKLLFQENSQTEGYICEQTCTKKPYDYLIQIRPGIFNKTLPSETIFQDFQDSLNNYLSTCTSKDDNCMIPIKIIPNNKLTIKNLEIIYKDTETKSTNKFHEISELPSEIETDELSIPLQTLHLSTDETGIHILKINFLNLTNTTNFTISLLPTAIITSKDKAYTTEEIQFSAEESKEINKSIIKYKWNFGDNKTAEGKITTHSYDEEGTYTVTLTIIDGNNLQDITTKTITIESLKSTIESLLPKVESQIFMTISNFESSTEKETIELLDLLAKVKNAKEQVESFKEQVEDADELESKQIYESLNELTRITPKSLSITTEITDYPITTEQDIKGVLSLLNAPLDRSSVISALQSRITTKANIKLAKLLFLDNEKQEITIIQKEITPKTTLNNIYLVEKIPSTIIADMKNHNFKPVSSSFKSEYSSFTGEHITYTVQANILSEINNIKTVLVSKELLTPKCGNGICDEDENSDICSEDCISKKVNYQPFLIVLIIFILGFIIYKFVLPKIPKLSKISFKKQPPFKSQKNLEDLQNYIKDSLSKNILKIEIRRKLLSKGWTKEQIDYAFKRVK